MGAVHPALYWLIIGVMMLFIELMLPGFVIFFFALGALITAAVSWWYPLSVASQLVLFLVTSLVALFALRNVIQKRFFTKKADEQQGEDKEEQDDFPLARPGDKGVVCMTIAPPAEGRIKYSGSYWRATAAERIDEGEIIQIVKQDGLLIEVEKV